MATPEPPYSSFRGRTCVVTGATSGIGDALARTLGAWGARLAVVGRDPARVESTARALSDAGTEARGFATDLGDTRAAIRLARELRTLYPRLDLLVNNAGGLFRRFERTASGVERTLGVNVLAPFVLSEELLPSLAASGAGRVVNVASSAHRMGRLHRADLEMVADYRGWAAYSQSKLALVLLTAEAARRHADLPVTFNSCHPGFVRSRFGLSGSGASVALFRIAQRLGGISPERGARTPLYLAGAPELARTTGQYFAGERARRPSRAARDPESARWLWNECARRVAVASIT